MSDSRIPAQVQGLAALEARLREDLERLCLPAADWLQRPDEGPLDVALVGAGMSGLAAAAALRFAGIHRIRLFDAAFSGQEGPWVTHARMETLRSPKNLVGPALGQPSLTFRAWYEAQYGRTGWEALGKIPRVLWQDYLNWFRTVLDLPVTNRVRVDHIGSETAPGGQVLVLDAVSEDTGTRQELRARHVVLATGMDALGRAAVPALSSQIPRDRWQHNTEVIDFAALRGRCLGVVGGGDSALDVAATALEAGAAEVLVFVREADFSRVNYWKAFTHPGHSHGFANLPPEARLRLLNFLKSRKGPPAQGTLGRLTRFENVRLHFNSPVTALAVAPDQALCVTTTHGQFAVDHLVFATGYTVDLAARKELTSLASHIRLWSDNPPPTAEFSLEGSPDLEADFSFREKTPGACPALGQVHLFTGAALVSVGKLTGDIPGISLGAERLARGITARLYAADLDQQLQRIREYDEPEVHGHEWDRIRVDH